MSVRRAKAAGKLPSFHTALNVGHNAGIAFKHLNYFEFCSNNIRPEKVTDVSVFRNMSNEIALALEIVLRRTNQRNCTLMQCRQRHAERNAAIVNRMTSAN